MNQQPWYQRFPKDEFGGEQSLLTCEEYGFFTRLRDFCWENDGLLFDEKILSRFAKAQKLSPYKFKKVWQVVEKFFENIDGKLRYLDDETKRLRLVERTTKCKISGIKGAESRWKRQMPLELGEEKFTDGDRHSEKVAVAMSQDGYPDPHPDPETPYELSVGPPPPPTPSENGGGGGEPPHTETQTLIPETDIRLIAARAESLGLQAPSRGLAVQIRQRFPVLDIDQLLQVLVLVPGQKSAGLWVSISADDLVKEARRQSLTVPVERKPSKLEENLSDLRQTLERREQKMAGGK